MDHNHDRIQGYFDRIGRGEDLKFEEAAEFHIVLAAIEIDDPSKFDMYEPIYSEHLYVQAFHLMTGPDRRVQETAYRNFNPNAELEKRLLAFDQTYQSNSVDLINRQIYKEYSLEARQAREKFSGIDLDLKIRMIKLKLEYVRIYASGVFKDYLWDQSLNNLNIKYGPIELVFDPVSLIHIINRHVIRNAHAGLQPLKGRSLLNLSELKQIIEKIQFAFSVIPIRTGISNSNELSFYFKNALNGEVYAVHTKTLRSSVGGSVIERQRVETFYPITETDKLLELQARGIRRIRQDFYLYN